VAYHYRGVPEFVVLGGLVPELLCSTAAYKHAGTTDVDVQVNLEIASDAVNGARLERALRAAGFEPENKQVWRWLAEGEQRPSVNRRSIGTPDRRAKGTPVGAREGDARSRLA
jgi:hypothetical protein